MPKDDHYEHLGADDGLPERNGDAAGADDRAADDADVDAPDPASMPHMYRRQRTKQFRTGRTFYLQDDTRQALNRLDAELRETFPNYTVQKIDVYEAVVRAGLFDTDVETEMRRIGYGADDRSR